MINTFKCNACDSTFENKIDLEKHNCSNHKENQLTEIVETSFCCNECNISFENKNDLEKHLSLKHKNYEETEHCEIKLAVFGLVDLENDVLEARTNIIEKLSEQEELVGII